MQITDRDRRLLAFAAEHRFVLAAQVAVLLAVTEAAADARLRTLGSAGYLRRERKLHRQPACDRITPAGLRAIGSQLPAPRPPDLAAYRHDEGLGWLMLAAWHERFGPVQSVISERRMRSEDGRRQLDDSAGLRAGEAVGETARHGVRLGGTGPGGRDRLHYPDMVLVTESGHRVAFELELTTKAPERRERILAGYAADPRVDAVVYLVDRPAAGRAIERSAARVGISHLVRVQRVTLGGGASPGSAGRTAERRHDRGPRGGTPAAGAAR
ncbi:MAG TPA: hypothetical protein VG325_11135 [Solirubrobacteraceae bacterium]|nr:hypothetical protein [Solirubrobacteraceae bacterium]